MPARIGNHGPGVARAVAVGLVLAAVLFGATTTLAAQQPTATPGAAVDEADVGATLAAARAAVAEELATVRADRLAAEAAGDADQAAHLGRVVEALEGVDRQLEAHQQARTRRAELEAAATQLAQEAELGAHLAGLTPDLDTYDGLLDERDALNRRLNAAALAEQVAGDKLALMLAESTDRRRAADEARAAAASNTDPARTLALRRDQRLKELSLRRVTAEAERRRVERDNAVIERANIRSELDLVVESIATLRTGLQVGADAIDRAIAALESRRRELEAQRSGVEFDLGIARSKATNLSERAGEVVEDPVVAERILGLKRDLARHEDRLRFLGTENDRITADIEAWKRRDDVFSAGLGTEKLAELRDFERTYIVSATLDLGLLRTSVQDLRALQDTVRQALESASAPEMVSALRLRQFALGEHIALLEQEASRVEASLELHQRLLEELELQIQASPLAEAWARVREALQRVWAFSLYDVANPNGGEPVEVTVGKLVNALLVFIVGLILARMLARWLAARVFPRFHLDAAASATYRTLVFYFLQLTVFLSVLRIMDIPLTAFTVLGGALAIGVGFGSQNLVNNFISGLIIMAERPVRIGDLIEVDQTYGIVESIGARSTTVLTSDNVNIVIPNSSFLENNVVNWTLSNDVLRTKVQVGVAYGSPTRDVDRLLYRAVEEHGKILKLPAPQVIFEDFGDNALIFDVYFWIRARTVMERRRVQSDVRFRIDNLFREAGITIAFPQRDVHLDNLSPLEVRMLPPRAEGAPPPAKDRPSGNETRARPGAGSA